MKRASRLSSCLIGLLVLVVSCKPVAPQTVTSSESSPTPLLETPVVANAAPLITATPFSQPDPASAEVLRFTFPTPGPEPVSSWRPALYPIPWALGPYDHFYFARPIAADVVNWPLKDYRYGGIFFGADIVHTGVDIPNKKGTPVLAAAAGKVISTGYGLFYGNNDPNDPYGLAVSIQHDFGYNGQRLYTIYAHMDRIDVIPGQWVDVHTPLGAVGDTGLTTGPHLHFEVRMENNSFYSTRNPELWLAPPQGWGVLVGRLMNTNTNMLTRQDVEVKSLDTGRVWTVTTYGKDAVVSDEIYRENLVLSDLPAGMYEVSFTYQDEPVSLEIEIHPGAISYFKFQGKFGFDTSLPGSADLEQVLKPYNP